MKHEPTATGPKKPRSQKRHKTVVLALRCDPAEAVIIRAAATGRGMTVSSLLRSLALGTSDE